MLETVLCFYKVKIEYDWFTSTDKGGGGNPDDAVRYNAWLNLPINVCFVILTIRKYHLLIEIILALWNPDKYSLKYSLTSILYLSTMAYISQVLLLVPDFFIDDY